jgi:hypothetical protein
MPEISSSGRKTIPETPAGQRAFEIMRKVAERMWHTAQDITAEFARETIPQAETIREHIVTDRYIRTMRDIDGKIVKIAYDYRERAVLILDNLEESPQQK